MENNIQNIGVKLRKQIEKISNERVRELGRLLSGGVSDMTIDDEFVEGTLGVYGLVSDDDDFETDFEIDLETDKIIDFNCECDYSSIVFFEKGHICEHIAATMYKYIRELENGSLQYLGKSNKAYYKVDGAEILINYFNKSERDTKELVNIDVSITEIDNGSFEASFKIGTKKMYVLKNIFEFVNAISSGNPLEFGKGFVFNPQIHKFSNEDYKIIDFIIEYANNSSVIDSTSYGYYYRPQMKLVKNKAITLINTALRRFLECAQHKNINIDIKEFKGKANIIQGDIPLSFSIKEADNQIILNNNSKVPINLIEKGNVFLFNEDIYLPGEKQSENYLPFIRAFKDNSSVAFKKEQADKVFTSIIPAIKTITEEIALDKSIEEKIATGDLKLEFYFDRDRSSIWCNVKASYDDQCFDIIKKYTGEKYIVRDVKKESDAISTLEDSKFYTNKDKFEFTGNDEELYRFLGEGIELFKDLGEVYYSDRFKEQKVYKSQAISALIKENSGFLEFNFSIDKVEAKEFNDILKAFKSNRKFYKLKNNSFIDLEDKKTLDFLSLLDNVMGDKKIKGNSVSVDMNKAIYMSDTIENKEIGFIKGSEVVDSIAKKFESIENVDYIIPSDLNTELRDYQITGFKWLKTLSHYGFGGILADEMGLGKTVQTIAFLLSEKRKKSLIVTPTSLIYNWKKEFEKFAPSMKICVLHGIKEQRLELMKDIKKYDVILTTYGTLRNDFSEYEKLKFDYCIIDEGQNIKNPLSQSSETVKDIRAKVKFALTGTPIENNLMELWSIFDFVMPRYLYNKTKFQEKFIGSKDEEAMKELKKLIRPFILRRLKSNVIEELPDKIEKKFFVEMTNEQKKVYSTFVNDIQEKMESEDFTDDKITVFSYLTKLRQLCLEPSIIVDGYTGGSAKVNVALDIIRDNIENGNKILLFSQFTSVLARLKEELDKNTIGYYYLDGSTKATSRMDLVDSFNEDNEKNIFLISLKAGGTGLNLTSANVVIHFDPWWNPAIEDQATDRAHRIGQKNVVEVIKLISQGTVEEKIITMQEAKKELINQVMEGDFKEGSFLRNLSNEEIKDLFK